MFEKSVLGKGLIWFLVFLLFVNVVQAQSQPEMADALRENGKIYVVVLVLITIFIGILIYVIYLDRKITRLEKNK